MKKILFVSIVLFCLTGCSLSNSTMTCKFENQTGYKYSSTIVIKYKDENIKNSELTMLYENLDNAKTMCDIFKNSNDENVKLTCNDKSIVIENYHLSINKAYEVNSVSKFKEYLTKNSYTCE